jgi:NADH-quinone oxidoreductase subunit N
MLLDLLPHLILSAGIVIALLATAFVRRNAAPGIAVVALAAGLIAALLAAPQVPARATDLFVLDGLSSLGAVLVLFASLSIALLSCPYFGEHDEPRAELFVLLLLGALGGTVLASSSHIASLILGIELVGIPLVAMAAYLRGRERALEAGFKYLVLSGISSAFLLFGAALLYAASGSLSFGTMVASLHRLGSQPAIYHIGAVLLTAGLGFKLALVPFHLWAPDVYEGAPAPVTIFAATVSKAAAVAVLLRLFPQPVIGSDRFLFTLFAAVSLASMTLGNVLALRQVSIKRMLAYSSIAHSGYLLIGLIAGGTLARPATALYLVSYVITNLGAFGAVSLLAGASSEMDDLAHYRGLFWRRPLASSVLALAVLSLLGIPLTAGFIAKYSVAAAGVESRHFVLVIALVMNTAISASYYLRIIMTMFFDHELSVSGDAWRAADPLPRTGLAVVMLSAVLVIAIGVMPQHLLGLIERLLD